MTNNLYEVQEKKSDGHIRYLFVSIGKVDVIKIVQYEMVEELNGRRIYNLGFGDYDFENGTILDDRNTNNGDVYTVFNTVLSTIPSFFESFSNGIIMVEGSDSRPEFVGHCKENCGKKCVDECKNFNRRINIYRNYIDKHYNQLSIDYQFLGGYKYEANYTDLEGYVCGKKYDAVFLLKRNV